MKWLDNARDKKIEKLRKQVRVDNSDAKVELQYQLGILYMKKGDNMHAKFFLNAAIEKGHSKAQSKLTELEVKIEKDRKRRDDRKVEAEREASRPKCAYSGCNRAIPYDTRCCPLVDMKDGTHLDFCSLRCKTDYEMQKGLNFQKIGGMMYREV